MLVAQQSNHRVSAGYGNDVQKVVSIDLLNQRVERRRGLEMIVLIGMVLAGKLISERILDYFLCPDCYNEV